MPYFEMLSAIGKTEEPIAFTFKHEVKAYVVAIQHFFLQYNYGTDDHHVREISIALDTGGQGRAFTVTPRILMEDDSKNPEHYNYENARITVAVFAVTDGEYSSGDGLFRMMPDQTGSNGNSASSDVTTYAKQYRPSSVATLSGFKLRFTDDDYSLLQIYARTALEQDSAHKVTVTSDAFMKDNSGHSVHGSVRPGVVVSMNDANDFCCLKVSKVTASHQGAFDMDAVVPPGRKLTAAIPVLAAFDAQYQGHEHYMMDLNVGVGAPGPDAPLVKAEVKGNSVTFPVADIIRMRDKGGNHIQDNSKSSVDLLIFGALEPLA